MTVQARDQIVFNNKTHRIYGFPLDQFFEKRGKLLNLQGSNSALWRGYLANWLIEHDKLFLIDFWGEHSGLQIEYDLSDLFPNQKKVFAEWFTGEILINIGKPFKYSLKNWSKRNIEYDLTILISEGIVTNTSFDVAEFYW